MIIDYDHNPHLTADQRLRSLVESVQMALNEWSAEKKSLDETDAKLAAAIDSLDAQIEEQQEYFWHDSSGTHMANADKTAGVIVDSNNITQVKKCSDIEFNIETTDDLYTALQNIGWSLIKSLKGILTRLVKRSMHYGTEIQLGTVTLTSGGYYQFQLGNSVPSGATIVAYVTLWGSATGAFSVPSYGSARAQYVVGTPNTTITNLRLIPMYYL